MKNLPIMDENHGRDGYTHCGDQQCCWGARGSRVGAPKKKKKNNVRTPECDKLLEVKDESQSIGDFLDWLTHEKKIVLCEWREVDRDEEEDGFHDGHYPTYDTIEQLLAKYFEINLKKLEKERRKMLANLQKKNKGA